MLDIKQLIEQTLQQIKTALSTEIANSTPVVMSVVAEYVADAKTRLTHLIEGALSEELSYKFIIERLQEEPTNVKNQLLSIAHIVATDLDQLAGKIVDILRQALEDAIAQSKVV